MPVARWGVSGSGVPPDEDTAADALCAFSGCFDVLQALRDLPYVLRMRCGWIGARRYGFEVVPDYGAFGQETDHMVWEDGQVLIRQDGKEARSE
ncbi:hypothetical protein [Streptomyces sp. NPDC002463]|uniref:hypothetical protein n=1 Tax=Streptomyces sp. NPDC002463 TaxID=3364645 RepID=UPI0036C96F45